MTGRQLPDLFNLAAEDSLIGAALLAGLDVLDAPTVRALQPSDFWDARHASTWRVLRKLQRDGVDVGPITVAEQLRQDGEVSPDLPALIALVNSCESVERAAGYAEIVQDYARRRRAQAIASNLGSAVFGENGRFVETLEATAQAVKDLRAEAIPDNPILSATDLLADSTPIPPDVVEGFIPGQAAILLSGPGGDGKSFAMLDLAVCVARGVPWLGLDARQCPVLIFDLENRKTRMRQRLRMVLHGHNLLNNPPPVHLCFDVSERLDGESGVLEIARQVETVGAGLVLLDSLVDFLGDVDENSNPEMGHVAERLRAIAETTSASVVAIHHTPKHSGNTPRGATALRNGVDVNILVARDGSTFTMRQDKNRVGQERTVTARLNWADGMFNLSPIGVSVGREQKPPDKDEAAILEALDGGDWKLSNEVTAYVMDKTKHARTTVQGKITAMISDMVLERQEESSAGGKPYHVRLRPDSDGQPVSLSSPYTN